MTFSVHFTSSHNLLGFPRTPGARQRRLQTVPISRPVKGHRGPCSVTKFVNIHPLNLSTPVPIM